MMTTTNERACPECGNTEDLHFRIDETVWCLACDWEGHEDDLSPIGTGNFVEYFHLGRTGIDGELEEIQSHLRRLVDVHTTDMETTNRMTRARNLIGQAEKILSKL